MIDRIKEKVSTIFSDEETPALEEDKRVVVISADGGAPPEPELRVVGLYTDINEEKVAEVTQALLYLNESNKLRDIDEEETKPIHFYISTYGGNADDMFALYDIMKEVQKDTEIHTIGMGKVMSAGEPKRRSPNGANSNATSGNRSPSTRSSGASRKADGPNRSRTGSRAS